MRNICVVVLLVVLVLGFGCEDKPATTVGPVEVVTPAKPAKKLVPAGPEFFAAALDGEIVTVKAAIERGVDVNSLDVEKRSGLMLAAFNGYLSTVEFLIKNGADVNLADVNGRTALLFAASGDNPETVKLLLENKAEINRLVAQ